ncbi:MAG: hypothetical protein K0U76_05755 [Actinomycetia bacterium]|nr:hypothetical protein [Actinomycetes bacterium]
MRFVLGLSLTESSAAWALVDTADGSILAEEAVAPDSAQEIARAAARSVQAFDAHTEHDIEGIRLTWTDDAHHHGTRLRTKLRLFGFETVETVPEEAALAGRNKTARHLPPYLTLAYGAARSGPDADETAGVISRLAARIPVRVAAASGAAAAVAAAAGVGLYGFGNHSTPEGSYTPAAEPNAQAGPQLGPAPASAPPPQAEARPPLTVPTAVAKPPTSTAPSSVSEPVAARSPATAAAQPETVAAPGFTTEVYLDSTVPESLPTTVGVPHLPAAQHLSRPGLVSAAPPLVVPATVPAQQPGAVAPPGAVPPAPLPPAPLPPVLSSLFGGLP